MLLLLLSFFTRLLLAAVVDTVFPERKKLSFAVAVALVVVALGAIAYSIAITVIHSQLQARLIVDASGPLIPGVSFLFSAALTAMWAVAWRLVETKQKGMPGFSEMRRNAVVFFAGSALLTVCFLSWFIVALLELTVDYYKYRTTTRALEVTSLVLTVLAILAYTGTAVIAAGREQSKSTEKAAGCVPLDDSAVPMQYADF